MKGRRGKGLRLLAFQQGILTGLEPADFVQMFPEKLSGFFTPTGLDQVEQVQVLQALRHQATAVDVGFVAHEASELVLPTYGIYEEEIARALHDHFVKLGANFEQLGT